MAANLGRDTEMISTGPAESWFCRCYTSSGDYCRKLRGPETKYCVLCGTWAPWMAPKPEEKTMPDEIDPNVEWCILFPNGTRVEISNLEDAIAIQQQSNGKAQWRSGWKDLDDLEVGTQKVDFRKS